MKYARQRDKNEPTIVEALRMAGAAVQRLDGIGVPDLLVSYGGVLRLLEVKSPDAGKATRAPHRGKGNLLEGVKSALTDAQRRWWEAWTGEEPAIVHNVDEALAAVGAKR